MYHDSSVHGQRGRRWLCAFPSIPVVGVEEATSLFALEAMACGKPVVASAIGGLKEMIRNRENGILVPPARPDLLADAILELIRDRQLSDEIGEAARESVLDGHSWACVAAKVSAIYAGL